MAMYEGSWKSRGGIEFIAEPQVRNAFYTYLYNYVYVILCKSQ